MAQEHEEEQEQNVRHDMAKKKGSRYGCPSLVLHLIRWSATRAYRWPYLDAPKAPITAPLLKWPVNSPATLFG